MPPGPTCADVHDPCEPKRCHPSSQCQALPEGGYKCECPMGREGRHCEKGTVLKQRLEGPSPVRRSHLLLVLWFGFDFFCGVFFFHIIKIPSSEREIKSTETERERGLTRVLPNQGEMISPVGRFTTLT